MHGKTQAAPAMQSQLEQLWLSNKTENWNILLHVFKILQMLTPQDKTWYVYPAAAIAPAKTDASPAQPFVILGIFSYFLQPPLIDRWPADANAC